MQAQATWTPQPNTHRARRSPIHYDERNDRIAYASGNLAILRSVETPTEALLYKEHTKPVSAVAVAPSGFYAASCDPSGQVYVWSTDSDSTKGPFGGVQTPSDLAWDFESKRLIVVGDGSKFGVALTADSGNTVGDISGHAAPINAVAVRPKRPFRAVTVDDDGKIAFFTGVPFKFERTCAGHTNSVSDVKYKPDGSQFVTVGMDKKIGLWDGETGEFVKWVNNEHKGGILAVDWVGDEIVTASTDKSVRVGSDVFQLPDKMENQQVGVVATKKYIISLGLDGTLYYWQRGTSEPVKTVRGHQRAVNAVASDGSTIFSGSIEGNILKWTDGAADSIPAHSAPIVSLVEQKGLWSAGWDKKLIHDGKTIELEAQPVTVAVHDGNYASISETQLQYNGKTVEVAPSRAVDLSSKFIAVGTGVSAVLYDLDLKQAHKFDPVRADVSIVKFSPDGKLLAVGDNSGKIVVYNVEDKSTLTSRWAFHNTTVKSIAWHPSGKYAATCGADSSICVYSVGRPARKLQFLDAHKGSVNSVAWSGESIVSGGADGCIKLWSVDTSSLE